MGLGDGAVVGTTHIVDNGSPASRWNLVIVGDGYRQADLPQFAVNAQGVVDALFAAPPFSDGPYIFASPLTSAVNVFRVDVRSTDTGADDPAACGGTNAAPATFFDASFCNGGIRRLLQVNSANVIATVSAQVPEWHAILVLVNSNVYGGGGGAVATSSLAPGALEIALHELGHSAFGLADEYEYWAGCGVDAGHDHHPAGEPSEPNVTATLVPLKWDALRTPGVTVPTTTNANCAQCDPQGNPVGPANVGAFEGAHYYHCGAWRPQFSCRMRSLGVDWCSVCQQRIRDVLAPFRPVPKIFDLLDRLERAVLRRPQDWIVDPAVLDLSRLARVTQRMRVFAGDPVEEDLSLLATRIESMTQAEQRAALLRVRSQVARLESTASTLEAALRSEAR